MGSVCATCKGESKESLLDLEFHIPVLKIHEQYNSENFLLENTASQSKRECDAEYTISSSAFFPSLVNNNPEPSSRQTTPESLYQSLSASQCSEINISELLMSGDNKYLNLTRLVEGVVFAPRSVFQLPSGSLFKGEFDVECRPHGRGVELRVDGSKYIGYFSQGRIDGPGKMLTSERMVYEGSFVTRDGGETTLGGESSVLQGIGKEIWPNGISYEGEFYMGVKHGKGRLVLEGSIYEGEFDNDEMSGNGVMEWENGKKYQGEWRGGLMHGEGVFTWPNGKVYKGRYESGEKAGKGIMEWPNKRVYDGEWKDGKQHGVGKFVFFDNKKGKLRARAGEWEHGERKKWISPKEFESYDESLV